MNWSVPAISRSFGLKRNLILISWGIGTIYKELLVLKVFFQIAKEQWDPLGTLIHTKNVRFVPMSISPLYNFLFRAMNCSLLAFSWSVGLKRNWKNALVPLVHKVFFSNWKRAMGPLRTPIHTNVRTIFCSDISFSKRIRSHL